MSSSPTPARTIRTATMIAVGVIAFGWYMLLLPRPWPGRPLSDSPRESIGYVFARQAADGAGASIDVPAEGLPADIAAALAPRDTALVDGRVAPQDFVGVFGLYVVLFAVWDPLVTVVVPIAAVVSAFLLVQLWAELSARPGETDVSWRAPRTEAESRMGLALFGIWLSAPALATNATWIVDSGVLTLVAVELGILGFVRFARTGSTKDFALLTASLAAATLLRYPAAVIAAVLGVGALRTGWVRKPHLIGGALAAAAVAAAISTFNAIVYGNAFTTGYGVAGALPGGEGVFTRAGFLGFEPRAALGHAENYLVHQPLVLLPAVVGFVVGVRMLRRHPERRPWIFTCLAVVASSLTYVGRPTWGWAAPAMNASFARYALPTIAIGLLLLAAGLQATARWPSLLLAACGGLALLGVDATIHGPVGTSTRSHVIAEQADIRSAVLRSTESDAFVMTRIGDRYLFPDRSTLSLSRLASGAPRGRTTRDAYAWDVLPDPDRLTAVAKQVLLRGHALYLLADFSPETLAFYRASASALGLDVAAWAEDPLLFRITLPPGERDGP